MQKKKKFSYPHLPLGERPGLWVSRLCWVLGPLLGFYLVELLNHNHILTDFSGLQIGLNLAFYYILAGLVFLVTGRRNLSCGISVVLFWGLGMANHYVTSFRGRTIFPGDLLSLQTAANVAGNYSYAFDRTQYLTLGLLLLFLLLLTLLPPQKGRSPLRLRSALPAAVAGLAFLGLFFGTGFLARAGVEPSMWTTTGNGFVLNFSVCLRYSRVAQPEGYSPQALQAIEDGLPKAPPEGVQPVNLIVIMNESFSDLDAVADLPQNQDELPFWHSLRENTVRGSAYASVFGGTTANSEYEFLTGHSTAFLPAGTVPYHMYVRPDSNSLVDQLNNLGYRSVALHPYLTSGWNRVAVYRDLGFAQALFQSDFQDKAYMRDYVTDRSNYENVLRLLEEKNPGEKLFLFNVTMQNHSAYNVPWKNLEKTTYLTGAYEGKYPTVDQYLSLLYESDKAFEYLITSLADSAEPTMVLMFGDHQPQVATNFYKDLLGDSPDLATAQTKYAVPFLIWANYDIPEEEGIETSLSFLSARLMTAANLPKTGYQKFAEQLEEEVPAMNANGFLSADGTWAASPQALPPAGQTLLGQYQMLQYNELFEKREDRKQSLFTLPEK
ncbi:MAG: LTA synthase family protein [Pseudoflavonifractor sp.]